MMMTPARAAVTAALLMLPNAASAEFRAHQFQFSLEPGYNAQEFVRCDDGEHVVSGGFVLDHSGSFPDGFTRIGSVMVNASSPTRDNGSMVQFVNISDDKQNGVLHILISCEEN